jgi:hypothetical protein
MDCKAHLTGKLINCEITRKPVRTLSEILIEADNNQNDLTRLKELAAELVDHKKFYPLVEITFGLEHILNYGRELQARIELQQLLDE